MLYRLFVVAVVIFSLGGSASSQTTAAQADFDGSGVVDTADFLQFVNAFGSSTGDEKFQAKFDLDGSGSVDIADFLQFVDVFGKPATTTPPEDEPVEEDHAALVALYHATRGEADTPGWTDKTNWLSDKPLNEWHGVSTNAQGRVDSLNLDQNNLSGELPEIIGDLGQLVYLNLSGNDLSGHIPESMGKLSHLEVLELPANQLGGRIPPQLGNLQKLRGAQLKRQ